MRIETVLRLALLSLVLLSLGILASGQRPQPPKGFRKLTASETALTRQLNEQWAELQGAKIKLQLASELNEAAGVREKELARIHLVQTQKKDAFIKAQENLIKEQTKRIKVLEESVEKEERLIREQNQLINKALSMQDGQLDRQARKQEVSGRWALRGLVVETSCDVEVDHQFRTLYLRFCR